MPEPRKADGFTLLEVMVALFILAMIAAMVSQAVHQRTRTTQLERERLPLVMCARALNNEFRLAGYWPDLGRHEGRRELPESGGCYWRLEVENTQVKRLRRATLSVAHTPMPASGSLDFTIFLAP
ncbi:bacterial type II secretion system protein I/J [Halomonas elongata]|uniref:Type II secretion system protein I n=1 Tax=Halomonas elongata TaxID=2746 RepID=A0A1B8NY95_HALEL|nr:type II secretion system minor pseudopilin GspI [Halomonas elongata]OBX34970.1 bacterial type II secretion system protein I/J [Halomonas elongata]